MVSLILFIFGIAIGSFLNVVALRYDGEHFLFNTTEIGGRSHCPHCHKTLQWFELFPVVSYIVLGGRCRNCKAKIGIQYPIVELISGIIFVAVPLQLSGMPTISSVIWIIALEILLLMSYIDILLGIIPDELNIALGLVAIADIWITAQYGDHLLGAVVAVALFGGIVAATRGKGMGMGDVKLALPLGLLFGWPDIAMIAVLAFIIGGIFGLGAIAFGKKTMKGALPFGPFLALASVVAFFWGSGLFNWYFHMIGL